MIRRAITALLFAVASCLAQALPNGLELVRFEVRASDPAVAGGTASVEITLRASRPLDATGTWRFWPGFRLPSRKAGAGR